MSKAPARPRRRHDTPSNGRSRLWTRFATALLALGVVMGLVVGTTSRGEADSPGDWVELGYDSFNRDSEKGWGSAEVGGAYAIRGSAILKVDEGMGTAQLRPGHELVASLPKVSAADVSVADSVLLAGGAGYDAMHGWGARRQPDGSGYTARVRFSPDGRATLGLARQNGTQGIWLAGSYLPAEFMAGRPFHGKLQVVGTSPVLVSLSVWMLGQNTPPFVVSFSDSSPGRVTAAGWVDFRNYVKTANGMVTVIRDEVEIDGSAPPAPAPAPGGTPSAAPKPTSAPVPTLAPEPAPTVKPSVSPTSEAPKPTLAPSVKPSPTQSPTPSETPTSKPPAPTEPPTVPPTAPTSGRGALPVGTASYAVPGDAVVVDGSNGSNGNDGSLARPLKTLQAAVDKVRTGGTVVLRAGTYHDSAVAQRAVTIQNYPGEAVWLDGSVPVSGWSRSGDTWVSRGWTAEFSSSMGEAPATAARFTGGSSVKSDPDQVFLDGKALRQVGSAGEVGPGEFYVNDGADSITIGSDPSGREVRASDLAQALVLNGGGSTTVQGIGVRRYANGYEVRGAIRVQGSGGTVRNVVVEDVATIGISMSGDRKTLDRVTVRRAGLLGVGGHRNDNTSVTNSVVSGNNTEGFNVEPVSGGLKFTASRTITVKNVEANNNVGSGIWLDVSSWDMTIVNNTANGNTKHGIEVEISARAIVANNQAVNGGEDGILILNSSDIKLFNNEVGGSSLFGIKLGQDQRRQADLGSYAEGRDPRYAGSVDPNMTWITKNIQVANNVFGTGGLFQLYALDGRTNRDVDTWNVTVTGNLFNAKSGKSDPTMVAWGQGDNRTLERYDSPSALAGAKNGGWKNAQTGSAKPILSMDGDKDANASVATPIPSDVAEATGRLAAGSKVVGVR